MKIVVQTATTQVFASTLLTTIFIAYVRHRTVPYRTVPLPYSNVHYCNVPYVHGTSLTCDVKFGFLNNKLLLRPLLSRPEVK